jgi:hypothetical protein
MFSVCSVAVINLSENSEFVELESGPTLSKNDEIRKRYQVPNKNQQANNVEGHKWRSGQGIGNLPCRPSQSSDTLPLLFIPTNDPLVSNLSRSYGGNLECNLFTDNLLCLGFLCTQKLAQPAQRVAADNQAGGNSGLAHGDEALATNLLVLAVVGAQNIVLAFQTHLVWEKDVALAVVIKLASWLLDSGELGFQGAEGRISERIGLAHIG